MGIKKTGVKVQRQIDEKKEQAEGEAVENKSEVPVLPSSPGPRANPGRPAGKQKQGRHEEIPENIGNANNYNAVITPDGFFPWHGHGYDGGVHAADLRVGLRCSDRLVGLH